MTSILHVRNIANVGAVLAAGQRSAGHKSVCVQIISKKTKFKADVNLDLPPNYSIFSLPKRLKIIKGGLAPYMDSDIFHMHDGGLYPNDRDIISLKKKRPVVVHWHGSKLRNKGQQLSKHASKIFVSTPDLLELAPGSTWIPNPIDLSDYSPNIKQEGDNKTIKIVHAPTNRAMKGTDIIEKAVNSIAKENYNISLEIIEGRPHSEVVQKMRNADIVFDQINTTLGTYGIVSIEAMALGKPVLCFLDEKYDKYYKNCPVRKVNETGLKNSIEELIEDSGLCMNLGQSGRKYVEEIHDLAMVVKQIDEHYRELI